MTQTYKSVSLVIPPSVFLLDERVFVSLGILKVAARLLAEGYQVDVLDLSGIANYEEALRYHVAEKQGAVYGITTTTPQLPATRRLIEVIRQTNKEARIILGGPHITLTNAAKKKESWWGRAHQAFQVLSDLADVLVAGDGEEAIFWALTKEAPKLIDADSDRSPLFLRDAELEKLPWPARHLVDLSSYRYQIEGHSATSLIAQLGCPFSCGFCGGRFSPSLRHIRTRSAENIVEEMTHLHHVYGFRAFMLYDDELNVNTGMINLMQKITEAQEKNGSSWFLRGFVKAELFTKEQAEAMYRAGFRWILVGFESGSPRILTNINKRSTRDTNSRALEIAHRAGLKVKALMSVGHPGESEETIRDTEKWLLEAGPDDFDVTVITTYPGTPYYDEAKPHPDKPGEWVYTYKKTGDRLYAKEVDFSRVAGYYKGDPSGGYQSYVYTDSLKSEEIVLLRDETEQTVRTRLGVPWNKGAPTLSFEHSMGQSGPRLPPFIWRKG